MSTPIPYTDCRSIFISPTLGFGETFKNLRLFYDREINKWRNAETLGRLVDIISSLDELCKECSSEGWDGYGAHPITEDTCNEAKKFVKSLPTISFPIPEIIPEPNGGIGLEWSNGNQRIFVASVNGENQITYAGLFGINKIHGSEYFGDSLPSTIIENIKRVYL